MTQRRSVLDVLQISVNLYENVGKLKPNTGFVPHYKSNFYLVFTFSRRRCAAVKIECQTETKIPNFSQPDSFHDQIGVCSNPLKNYFIALNVKVIKSIFLIL